MPPYPKSQQLARGERRAFRKKASRKEWRAIRAAKIGPCRWCEVLRNAGFDYGPIELHHLVRRSQGGGDAADNLIPLHRFCHRQLHVAGRSPVGMIGTQRMLAALSDAEYAYMIEHGGEDYPERAYGVRYER